jgi:LysR family transcriptional regulator, low CO2-responsive transcriptional regulator
MRRLTLKQLQTIRAVAQSGTIVAAAQAMNVTPAALTARIKLLEEDAGVALFDRTGGRLRLTDVGREVVNVASGIENALAGLENTLNAHRGMQAGRIAVGVVSTAKYFAPRLIAAFAKEKPRIEIAIHVGNRTDIIAALRDGAVDIALMGRPPEDLAVNGEIFGPHPQVIIAPPDHALVGRRDIDKSELAEQSFIVREAGSGTRSMFDYFFDVVPHISVEIGSNETIKQAVMAGLGLTLISALTIEAEVAQGRLAVLDIKGLPIMRQLFVVHRADRVMTLPVRALWDYIISEGRNFLPVLSVNRTAFPSAASPR